MRSKIYAIGGYLFDHFSLTFATVPGSSWRIVKKLIGEGSAKILDVGCADGDMVRIMGVHKKCQVVGVDLFLPYLVRAQAFQGFSSLLLGDANYLPFRNKSFDVVLCLEVIEHLDSKEAGKRLLDQLELLGKIVIVSTPNGLSFQREYGGNVHQEHHVGWLASDLRLQGYRVLSVGIKESYLIQRIKEFMFTFSDTQIKGENSDPNVVKTMKLIDLVLRVPYYLFGILYPESHAGHIIGFKVSGQ